MEKLTSTLLSFLFILVFSLLPKSAVAIMDSRDSSAVSTTHSHQTQNKENLTLSKRVTKQYKKAAQIFSANHNHDGGDCMAFLFWIGIIILCACGIVFLIILLLA